MTSTASPRSSTAVAPRRLVPAIGRIVTVSPFTRTRISGLAPTTWKPPKLKKNMKGEGFIRRRLR